jgi:hypothetical protein
MNRRPRRNHSPAFKAKVALAAIARGARLEGMQQQGLGNDYADTSIAAKNLTMIQIGNYHR